MAAADGDDSLYPIAVLIDELRNEDVQVRRPRRETPGARRARGWGGIRAGAGGPPSRRRFGVPRGVAEAALANQRPALMPPARRPR